MSKIINIVDKDNDLVASISEGDIRFHGDYKIIETDKEEKEEVFKPEVSF